MICEKCKQEFDVSPGFEFTNCYNCRFPEARRNPVSFGAEVHPDRTDNYADLLQEYRKAEDLGLARKPEIRRMMEFNLECARRERVVIDHQKHGRHRDGLR